MGASVADGDPAEEARGASLEHLGPDQLRTLAYASAIGREFDFPLLVAAIGADEEALAEQVERLTHLGILEERVGGDRFTFAQEELRARVYQSLTASRLRVIHRKVAEAMERLYPTPPVEIIPELGRHYFLGRVPEKSYDYNRKAAAIARADDAPEVAAHHLERARIDLRSLGGERDAEEAELSLELGDLYYNMGDLPGADRLYAEALQRAASNQPRLRARILLARAEIAREHLAVPVAVEGAQAARALFVAEGDLEGISSVHRALGRVAYLQGAYREALDEAMIALEYAQRAGDARLIGRLSVDIGNALAFMAPELPPETLEWYQRGIDRLTEVGDWGEVARAYLRLAIAVGPRHPADALEHLELAQAYAERGHEPRWAAWALFSRVEFRLALGEVEAAERENQQAGRLLERTDDLVGRLYIVQNRGLISERRGQWEDAEMSYGELIEQARVAGLPRAQAEGAFHLARLFYKTRDFPRAREAYLAARHLDLPRLNPTLTLSFADLGRELAVDERGPGEPTAASPSPGRPEKPSSPRGPG
jgi:tetratricopeptide (TPR) repeat protein